MPLVVTSFTASGNWVVPAGVISADFYCFGPGAAGAAGPGIPGFGGGAGAIVYKLNQAVTPTDTWSFAIVAATDTTITDPSLANYMTAKAPAGAGQTGGTAAASTGPAGCVKRDGGNGGNAGGGLGGGGGGAPSDLTTANNGAAGASGGAGGAATAGTYPETGGGKGGDANAGNGTAPGSGGAGGFPSGGTAGGGRVVIVYGTHDLPPPDPGFRICPPQPEIFSDPFPGKVLFNPPRMQPPVAGPATPMPGTIAQPETIPPFGGAVIQGWFKFGDPPVFVSDGGRRPRPIAAEPVPAFGGGVISLRAEIGNTPSTASAATNTYRPISNESLPFPGSVITAKSNKFGVPAVSNNRPLIARTENSEPFGGRVLTNHPAFTSVRDPLVSAAIVRTAEPDPQINQPLHTSGTPAREAVSRGPRIVAPESPPAFQGGFYAVREAFGLQAVPLPPAVVVRTQEGPTEPGRVIGFGNRTQQVRLPVRPSIVVLPPVESILTQPTFWHGTPAREAAYRTSAVIYPPGAVPFPGEVKRNRTDFGLSPIPSRPMLVQQSPGIASATEPGRATYGSKTPTAPVDRPRAVIVSMDTVFFPGHVLFHGGSAAPTVVVPGPMIVAGATVYPEVVAPFFGYGFRTGTGEPPGVTPGNPVSLDGEDLSAVTLTSEDCPCQ